MTLTSGGRLGPYEIVGPLGAGGMGEVWRARDPRLDRDVAIKALPAAVAHDPERVARFEREARLLARVSHAGIGGILGLEESDGRRYLILEFVEGETLERLLERGPLPLEEALGIARQIAGALEVAHDAGIVHRDLKPGNVMIKPDGTVKVLDFGLAKALADDEGAAAIDGSLSPTVTALGTQVGVLLGTGAYMAPEQAKGRAVDRRADIWAFGVVLWEMLTGRRLFAGETISETLAMVMMQPISWDSLPPATPPRVIDLLRRCLERDPRQRLQAIGEARIALEGGSTLVSGASSPAFAPGAASAALPPPPPPARISSTPRLVTLFAGLVGALAAVAFMTFLAPGRARRDARPLELSVALPPTDYATGGREHNLLAVSPDGRTIAWTARRGPQVHLFLRDLDSRESRLLPGTEDARSPFFSPDGRWVAFFAGTKLRKVSVLGGAPFDLCDLGEDRGGTWTTKGDIVFAPDLQGPLERVSADGGTPRACSVLDSTRQERTHRWPVALPGGEWVAFTVGVLGQPAFYDDDAIDVVSLKTGERRTITRGTSARWSPDGRLLVCRHGTIYALEIDPRDPRPNDHVEPVAEGIDGEPTSGTAFYDVAHDGTLVYVPGTMGQDPNQIGWIDLAGHSSPTSFPPQHYLSVRLSPDRRRVLALVGPGGGSSHLWLGDLATGTLHQLTFGRSENLGLWMRDGGHIVFGSQTPAGNDDIVVRSLDAAGETRKIWSAPYPTNFGDLTPDGRGLLFTSYGQTGPLLVLPLDGSSPPLPAVAGAPVGSAGRVSPDGRWLAYQSNRSARREVYVRPYAGGGADWQVSNDGGRVPLWSADGKTLYFVTGESMMAVSVEAGASSIQFGSPRALFRLPQGGDVALRDFDLDPVENRFLCVHPVEGANDRREIAVVPGWAFHRKTRAAVASQN